MLTGNLHLIGNVYVLATGPTAPVLSNWPPMCNRDVSCFSVQHPPCCHMDPEVISEVPVGDFNSPSFGVYVITVFEGLSKDTS